MTRVLLCIFLVALLNEHADYGWYLSRAVPVPFVSVVATTIALAALLFVRKCARDANTDWSRDLSWIVIFDIGCLLSVFGLLQRDGNSDEFRQFNRTLLHLLFYAFMVITLRWALLNGPTVKTLRVYVWAGVLLVGFAAAQFAHAAFDVFSWMAPAMFGSVPQSSGVIFRVASVFSEPSWFGLALVDWIGFAIGLYFWSGRKRDVVIACGVLLFGILMAASLSALISLMILVLLLMLLNRRHVRRGAWVGVGACMIGVGLVYLFSEPGQQTVLRVRDVLAGSDSSTNMRSDSTRAALVVAYKHPVFGVGFGTGQFTIQDYFETEFLRGAANRGDFSTAYGSDSFWALLLAETGLVGFALFIAMCVVLLRAPRGAAPTGSLWQLYSAARCVFALNVIQLAFTASFLAPRFWFNVAVMLALKTAVRRQAAVR